MKQFFKIVFGTLVGLTLFFTVGTLILIGILAAAGSSEKAVDIKDKSVLKISFDKQVQERERDNPFEKLNFSGDKGGNLGLIEIKEALKKAAKDDKIKGVYLDMGFMDAGFSQIEEIREALIEFKKSKKWIVTYAEFYTEGAYYLASVADAIYLNPSGELQFNGLSRTIAYGKRLFEKLDVKPEIFRVGKYKSAVEPFMEDKMSDANREQNTLLLGTVYGTMMKEISATRGINADSLRKISDNLLVQSPQEALQYKLITHIGYYDEFEADVRKRLKLEKADDEIEFVTISDVRNSMEDSEEEGEKSKDKIAVVIASGEIQGSKADRENIGSDDFCEDLRKAREDKNVKAIVVRINSPGGSALASDVMWREIQITKKVKPVIASMSTYAASGGYYMAMGCNKIVAMPNTITGSIGVFGMLFDASKLLNERFGLTFENVKTGKYSDIGEPTRPIRADEKAIIQRQVDDIYTQFTTKAAEGRKMDLATLQGLAEGRVWTGTDAKERGLVDELGNLEKAIEIAAKEAKIKDYSVKYLPVQKDFFTEIMESFDESAKAKMLKAQLGPLYPAYHQYARIQSWQGIQARMPLEFEF